MTSNIGSEHIDRMSKFGFMSHSDEKTQYAQAKDKVLESLKNFFRPEFLNRLDEIIIFDILTKETISSIVRLQVKLVIDRLAQKDIQLSISDEVMEYIAKEGYEPKFGARPLKRVIQSKILTPVASMMINEGMLQGGTVSVTMKKDELSFDVKKKGKSEARRTKQKVAEAVAV